MSPFVPNKPGPSTASSVSFALLLFLSSKALHSSSCGCAGWLRFIDRAGHLWVGSARPPHHSQLWKKVFFFKSCTVDWFCIVQRSLIHFGNEFGEFTSCDCFWPLQLCDHHCDLYPICLLEEEHICLFDVCPSSLKWYYQCVCRKNHVESSYLHGYSSCREKWFQANKKFNIP